MAAPKDGGRAAAGGGRRPRLRPEKMAAEERRRPLGRNGVVSPGGAVPRRGRGGARSGQRTAPPLVVRRPLPAGSPRASGARCAEGVGGACGPRAGGPAEPSAAVSPRLPLGGVSPHHGAPAPFPGSSTAPGRRLPKGGGGARPFAPTHRAGQTPPARRSPSRGGACAARRAGACGLRVAARPCQCCLQRVVERGRECL